MSGIQGAAGNYAIPITFTKVGRGSCWLRGYPGVSWVDRHGRTIGDPARRAQGEEVRRVVLKPHRAATSLVLEPTPSNQQLAGCTEKTAYGLRVYPPGSRRSYVISHDGWGWRDILDYCANGATSAVVMPLAAQ